MLLDEPSNHLDLKLPKPEKTEMIGREWTVNFSEQSARYLTPFSLKDNIFSHLARSAVISGYSGYGGPRPNFSSS